MGVDAVNYLKFQRHLIVFVGIITIACVGIVLPINFQGMFGRSEITKITPGQKTREIHDIIFTSFLALTLI